MGVIDKAFCIPTGKVGDCLVVGTSAQRLRSSENVPGLFRYLSRADKMVAESLDDSGAGLRAFLFGRWGGPSGLKDRVVPAIDRSFYGAVLQKKLGVGESLLGLFL